MDARSYSQFKDFALCQRRWQLGRRYEPKRKAMALDEGSAFHLALAQFYHTRLFDPGLAAANGYFDKLVPRDDEDARKILDKRTALEAVLRAYFEHVATHDLDAFEVEAVERPYSVKIARGLTLSGFIDGVWREKRTGVRFIVEHKYQADGISDELLALDLQISLYTLGLLPEFGLLPTLYNVARKPVFRQGKAESGEDFRKRLPEEVAGKAAEHVWNATDFASRFFERKAYSRSRSELDVVRSQVKNENVLMRALEKHPERVYRNVGDWCLYRCSFKNICIAEDPMMVDDFFVAKKSAAQVPPKTEIKV